MFVIKCPKCEESIKDLAADYVQWRSDRRKCPSCGARLALSNPFLCYGLCSVIFAVLLVSLSYWNFGSIWLRMVIVVLLCWVFIPIVIRIFGRWQVLPYGVGESMKLQRWTMVVYISGLFLAIAVFVTFISFGLQYRNLLREAVDTESGSYTTENFLDAVKSGTLVAFGIAVIALTVYIFALVMRKRARIAQKQRELETNAE